MSCLTLLRWSVLLASIRWVTNAPTTSTVPKAVPTIISTDIGTFMDDTFALAFALESSQLDIKLVVTASCDTTGRARVAAKHLSIAGAGHIPIGIGVRTSNETGPLFGWAADFDLDEYPGGVYADGVKAMQETIDSHHDTAVNLITIGPHTNVKSLLERFPGIEHRVRVFIMGGSVVPGIHLPWGHVTPVNTTNEKLDPGAARAMLHANWSQPLQFAPIATTYQVVIKGDLWQELRTSTRRSVQVVVECYHYWWEESRRNSSWITHDEAINLDPASQSNILFDVEVVHLASTKRWLDLRPLTVDFSNYGRTLVLPANSSLVRPALFALNWTDGHAALSQENGLLSFCNYFVAALLNSETNEQSTDLMQV